MGGLWLLCFKSLNHDQNYYYFTTIKHQLGIGTWHIINDAGIMMHVDTKPIDDKEEAGNERCDELNDCSYDNIDQCGNQDHSYHFSMHG